MEADTLVFSVIVSLLVLAVAWSLQKIIPSFFGYNIGTLDNDKTSSKSDNPNKPLNGGECDPDQTSALSTQRKQQTGNLETDPIATDWQQVAGDIGPHCLETTQHPNLTDSPGDTNTHNGDHNCFRMETIAGKRYGNNGKSDVPSSKDNEGEDPFHAHQRAPGEDEAPEDIPEEIAAVNEEDIEDSVADQPKSVPYYGGQDTATNLSANDILYESDFEEDSSSS